MLQETESSITMYGSRLNPRAFAFSDPRAGMSISDGQIPTQGPDRVGRELPSVPGHLSQIR